MFCNKCGAEIDINDKFCNSCGEKIENKDIGSSPLLSRSFPANC